MHAFFLRFQLFCKYFNWSVVFLQTNSVFMSLLLPAYKKCYHLYSCQRLIRYTNNSCSWNLLLMNDIEILWLVLYLSCLPFNTNRSV